MARYKVVFVRKDCIGAFACVAVHAERWIPADDGKVNLTAGEQEGDNFVVWIDEKELPKMKESAEVCPVNVIHIYDESGKQII